MHWSEKFLLKVINRITKSLEIKRLIIPVPLFFAKIFANIFEITMKNPLLTKDQLILLNYNNSPSENIKRILI